jgi:hypothetical protein
MSIGVRVAKQSLGCQDCSERGPSSQVSAKTGDRMDTLDPVRRYPQRWSGCTANLGFRDAWAAVPGAVRKMRARRKSPLAHSATASVAVAVMPTTPSSLVADIVAVRPSGSVVMTPSTHTA